MTYAKCRDYDEGETFPYATQEKEGYFPCCERLYPCWQPEEIADDEFNLVILLEGHPVKVRGCHFDFFEMTYEQAQAQKFIDEYGYQNIVNWMDDDLREDIAHEFGDHPACTEISFLIMYQETHKAKFNEIFDRTIFG